MEDNINETYGCYECVTLTEYEEFIKCWFNEELTCSDQVRKLSKLRSEYLLIEKIVNQHSSCCQILPCDPIFKEIVYTQMYYDDNVVPELTQEAYNLLFRYGYIYA